VAGVLDHFAGCGWNMITITGNLAIAEQADRTALSQIAVQHADDCLYTCRGNFDGSLVQYVLMHSPDVINDYDLRGETFEGIGSCKGLTVVKSYF